MLFFHTIWFESVDLISAQIGFNLSTFIYMFIFILYTDERLKNESSKKNF